MKFVKVESYPSFPAFEVKVLEKWKQEGTFKASLERNKGKPEYVFYDGPPFSTGTPHPGHLLVSTLKDVVPRFKTMKGYYVPRAWGWDCHGLPIETQVEKKLGIVEKGEIESRVGVVAFNNACRDLVSSHNSAWRVYVDRIGRWVDFDYPYSTRDLSYMESVLWVFKECYRKGLIYKDYRVSPYCYRCQTPLSISETRLDDSTRQKQDRALTVKFKVREADNLYFLAWTTTPWTLPSNLALAVGPEVVYVVAESGDGRYILAESALPSYRKELKDATVVERMSGQELVARGYHYHSLFPYFREQNPNGFCLLLADFVATGEGTGVVHMAPAFGEDDYWVCRKNKIAVINPVDAKGCFTAEVTDFAGQNVHEANAPIARHLKSQGVIIRDESVEHAYPFCWRCQTPLIYRALDAWYFSIESIKDRLIARNSEVNWYPESVKQGRFGKWLENARDWNISRNRYWATPIPVWECSACGNREVLGSIAELQAKAGHPLTDIHKEFLDPIKFPCRCGGQMERVPEVLDVWFESGAMPYAQFHYPFERREHFESHFPGDFIVEYPAQIRAWFYYMHVLAVALFNKPAFLNCVVHGTLLASDGKKMSKSQKNFTDPLQLIERYGGDAFRMYLLCSNAVLMDDLSFQDQGVEDTMKALHLPLWNALLFFTTYAEIDGVEYERLAANIDSFALSEMDRFILSELELLIQQVTTKLDCYMLHEAARLFPQFLDPLNNWYIRRSRQRVWSADKDAPDRMAFYAVLYRVLSRFVRVLAPFCPFLAEVVWERLANTGSVHLSSWPEVDSALINHPLSDEISKVRTIITAGLAIRAREKIRVRQPLAKLMVANSGAGLKSYDAAISEELNVKEILWLNDVGRIAKRIGRPNARLLGPKFGSHVQEIIKKAKAGDFEEQHDGTIKVGEFLLNPDEMEIAFVGIDGEVVESAGEVVVTLDTTVTPDLKLEGDARDLVRHIQELRKEARLNISDRIMLMVRNADDILSVHTGYVQNETLAVALCSSLPPQAASKSIDIGGRMVEVALAKHGQA